MASAMFDQLMGDLKAAGAVTKKDMGRIMKDVMARVKGQADGRLVSKLVGAALA